MELNDFLSRLESVNPSGDQHVACCPAHDDHDPSLSITEGDDGRILVHCHAGCTAEAVVEAMQLTMRDLMPNSDAPGNGSRPSARPKEALTPDKIPDVHGTIWDSVYAPEGTSMKLTWSTLADAVQEPMATEETRALNDLPLGAPKDDFKAPKKSVPVWSFSTFQGGHRKKEKVELVHGLCLDYDGAKDLTQDRLRRIWGRHAFVAYTTPSSCPDALRWRVMLPFTKPVTAEQHDRLVAWAAKKIEGLDARQAEQCYIVPVARPSYEYMVNLGYEVLDAEKVLRAIEEKRDRVVLGGDLEMWTRTTVAAMQKRNDPPSLFIFGSTICTLEGGPEGIVARPMTDNKVLREYLGRNFEFVEKTGGKKEGGKPEVTTMSGAPLQLCDNISVRPKELLPFPTIKSIVRTPGFIGSGTMLVEDGYHPEGQVVVSLGGLDVPVISAKPTQEAVDGAHALLEELFVDFPFVDVASKAAVFACLVTLFARNMIPGPVPAFLFSAPTQGTGKTLLAILMSIVATGRDNPTTMSLATDDTENAKRILAVLRKSPSIVLLDNLPDGRTIKSGELASVLTATEYEGRELGHTRSIRVPNSAVWMATGNNPKLSAELTDRCVYIRIVPSTENPRSRTGFKHKLPEWAVEHRGPLCAAVMTLVANWIAIGQPAGSAVKGSFSDWASIVSGVLEAAGITGLLQNQAELFDDADDETNEWRTLLAVLWKEFGEDKFTAKDVADTAASWDLVGDILDDGPDSGKVTRMGKALSRKADCVFGPFRLEKAGHDATTKSGLYKLVKVGDEKQVEELEARPSWAETRGLRVERTAVASRGLRPKLQLRKPFVDEDDDIPAEVASA